MSGQILVTPGAIRTNWLYLCPDERCFFRIRPSRCGTRVRAKSLIIDNDFGSSTMVSDSQAWSIRVITCLMDYFRFLDDNRSRTVQALQSLERICAATLEMTETGSESESELDIKTLPSTSEARTSSIYDAGNAPSSGSLSTTP